jgi:hypothetical protein
METLKLRKIRLEDTTTYRGDVIKVFKNDFQIFDYSSGYYSICLKGNYGGDVVWGGDSACEDHYNKDLIKDIYNQWDGTLVYESGSYRINI